MAETFKKRLIGNAGSGFNPVTTVLKLPTMTDASMNYQYPVPKGFIVLHNNQIKVSPADGTSINALVDHSHPNLAAASHTHIRSDNHPWMVVNPQLWYYPDVKNHPELIILNGQELDEENAKFLSKYYYGNRTLTTDVELDSGVFGNNEITLSVSAYTGSNTPDKLFGPDVDISNGFDFDDQWLTGNSSLTTEQSITVTFKGGAKYLPKTYRIVAASGTPLAECKKAPTPKNWVLEGEVDGSWTTLDTKTNITDWDILTPVDFNVPTEQLVTALRLKITEWNAGATVDSGAMVTGLRRFWVFGRKEGKFSVPNIPQPDDEFVYVIPKNNLNIGNKHEDVGDISLAVIGTELPKYRRWCDGSVVSAKQFPILEQVIGGTFDLAAKITTTQPSTGAETDSGYKSTDVTTPVVIDYTTETKEVISNYAITKLSSRRSPVSWKLDGIAEDGTATNIHTVNDLVGVETKLDPEKLLVNLKTITDIKPYNKYRFTVTKWDDTSNSEYGYKEFTIYTHPEGEVRLPRIDPQSNVRHYIVTDICTVDVSAEIISALQQNVVDLANMVSKLQEQLNRIEKEKHDGKPK